MITKQIEDKPLEVGESYWFRCGDIIDKIKLIDRELRGRNSYYLVSYKNKTEWMRADNIKGVHFKHFLDVYDYKIKNEKTNVAKIENNFISQQNKIKHKIEQLERRVKRLEQKIIRHRKIESVKKGYSSYPEFLCYTILTYCKDMQLINSFKTQVTFDFAPNKRYDFLINKNIIIETHGMQHYETNMYNTTTEEQHENDELKFKLAEQNGFIYFEIDCRWSKFDYCYENIVKTLSNVIDTNRLSKEKIGELCKTPFHEKVLKLWNDGLSTCEIANNLNVSINKITYELKRLNEMKLIEYNYDIAFQRGHDRRMEKERNKENPLILIEIKTGNVKRFRNQYELSKELKISVSSLWNCINGGRKTLRNQFIIKKEEEFEEDKVNEYICEIGTLKWTYFLKKDGIEYVYFDVEEVCSATYKRDEIIRALRNSEKDTIFYLGFEIRRKKINQKNFKLGKNQKFGTRELTSVRDSGLIYIAIEPETGETINSYTQKELIENKLSPSSVRNACPSKDGIIPTDRYGNRRKYKGYYWEKVVKN